MPWSCPSCSTEVAIDVGACPSCGAVKAAWTLVKDRTRAMVVGSTKRFHLRRGRNRRSYPADAPQNQSLELLETEAAVVLTEAQARSVKERGHLPAAADLTFVSLEAGKRRDLGIELEPLYATQAGEPLEFPRERQDDEPLPVVVPFLFVSATSPPADLEFEGVHVVAIGEGEPAAGEDPAFAPSVEFSALGKPAKELPTQAKVLPRFALSV